MTLQPLETIGRRRTRPSSCGGDSQPNTSSGEQLEEAAQVRRASRQRRFNSADHKTISATPRASRREPSRICEQVSRRRHLVAPLCQLAVFLIVQLVLASKCCGGQQVASRTSLQLADEYTLISSSDGGGELLAGAEARAPSKRAQQRQQEPIGAAADEDEALLAPGQPFEYHSNMPVITKRELAAAIKQATANEAKRYKWPSLADDERADRASGSQVKMFSNKQLVFDSELFNQTRQALVSEETTRLLAKQFKLNRVQILRGLPLISLDATQLGKQCARPSRMFACLPGRYRSFSGHCNNVQNADWGAAQTPLARYAAANFADSVARPPEAAVVGSAPSAGELPSARAVSLAVSLAAAAAADQSQAADAQQQHAHMTTMTSFFGQFLFHDLALVGQQLDAAELGCCATPAHLRHPECMPIELRDPLAGQVCIDYVRSMPAVRSGCNLGPRDQLNLATSYLDGSVVYGSSEEEARRLRTFAGGKLRSQRVAVPKRPTSGATGKQANEPLELLPQIKLPTGGRKPETPLDLRWARAAAECRKMAFARNRNVGAAAADESKSCFLAGDLRANENIGLTLMHTIWLREHNLVAERLASINRHWRDERLFEEARRIVVAELQHIAYSEFLPSILGEDVMQRFNLTTQLQGYSQQYEPQLNAALSNELAVAVFPFILSTIPAQLERYSERLEMVGATRLADTFLDGSDLFKSLKFGQYLTGMMSQSAMEPALASTPLAAAANQSSAGAPELDSVALTIQQGRDHGLRPYLYWRRACQLKPNVRTWSELAQVMPARTVDSLRRVYASVEQLDLYLALLEHKAPGATVGPTFVCLLARQFHNLKHGDRFWFENDLVPTFAFSSRQLDELRQSSLAKVLCRNSQQAISFVQPAPMQTSDPYLNAYQYCSNRAMGELDLSGWREPITSAQQVADEQVMDNLDSSMRSALALRRAKRLVDESAQVIASSLASARGRLELVAREESARKVRRAAEAGSAAAGAHAHRGYRYLPRLKRNALQIQNQSKIFELATNELVRQLVNQDKDRERAQSVEADVRDLLLSLEHVQLDNLLDNSATSEQLSEFVSAANGAFLSEEQRLRLAPTELAASAGSEPAAAAAQAAERTSSLVFADCQDDEHKSWPCDHTNPFRTITGWCNNLQRPKFGQSFTAHDRLLASAYADGLSRPRAFSSVAADGDGLALLELPSARLISTRLHDDRSQLHSRYSLALMQFGQFGVDHDLTRTPFSVALDGSLLDCSDCKSAQLVHRDCLPIPIPPDDKHYFSAAAARASGGKEKCLHFVRSLNGQIGLGPRQQLNALTSYLDASEIYGSDNCEARSLRALVGGRLNASSYPATGGLGYSPREILPVTRANPECATPSGLCFHAGDQRASEQPGLTAMHTIFMRLHNSIVSQLNQLNRHWNDERLYQTGRKIVGAILQRITFNEFAPRLLGLDYMSKFDLMLKQVGYAPSDSYDDSCSASILNEFAAAAFRMGHSLIRGAFPLLNAQHKPIGGVAGKQVQLRTMFFNSQRILTEPQLIDSILRGIVASPIETLDNSITDELTNHLFEKPREPHSGMDLVALNIQRARDHGVGPYNSYRVKCNLTRARTFDELAGEIPAPLIKRLASVYASVDDIDLFTGGISELPVHGGLVGPTLGCIIATQFSRLKRCDRFWHETSDPFVRFSAAQLAEIRKMTLSKVICSQSDTIDTIQRHAMDVPDHYLNPRVQCSNLPSMDLSVWRENHKSCLANKAKIELGQSKRVSPCKSCTCTLEGPVCRTVRMNCVKMMKRSLSAQSQTSSLNQIMADKSCLVQCSWALEMPLEVARR